MVRWFQDEVAEGPTAGSGRSEPSRVRRLDERAAIAPALIIELQHDGFDRERLRPRRDLARCIRRSRSRARPPSENCTVLTPALSSETGT